MIQSFIYAIGLFHILRFLLILGWEILKQILPFGSENLDKYGRKEGKWAVVTGGTDGIGLGFCEVLANMGWNVCIISRNQDKIKKTIAKLIEDLTQKKKKVPLFKYIVADFKNSSQNAFFDHIDESLNDIQIGILVNNVGTGGTLHYEQHSMENIIDLININCTSMAGLTSALIKKMKKSKCAIINLSSFLGQNPCPYSTLYSASKAFNTFFSQSLSMEERCKNIDVLSVRPMFVVSPLSKKEKAFTIPDRRQCAEACFKQLRWQYETNGYFIHRVLAMFARLFPKWMTRIVTTQQSKKQMLLYRKDQ